MKTHAVAEILALKTAAGSIPEEFSGVYAGDLLSRAMSHVTEGDLWITIMSNVNVIAVASLTEAAAVILAEGVTMDAEVLSAAEAKGVNVLMCVKTVYEICRDIAASVS